MKKSVILVGLIFSGLAYGMAPRELDRSNYTYFLQAINNFDEAQIFQELQKYSSENMRDLLTYVIQNNIAQTYSNIVRQLQIMFPEFNQESDAQLAQRIQAEEDAAHALLLLQKQYAKLAEHARMQAERAQEEAELVAALELSQQVNQQPEQNDEEAELLAGIRASHATFNDEFQRQIALEVAEQEKRKRDEAEQRRQEAKGYALHEAVKVGDLELVKALILGGFEITRRDKDGHIAWFYAFNGPTKNVEIQQFALEHSAQLAEQNCPICFNKVGKTQFAFGDRNNDCVDFICLDCKKANEKAFIPDEYNPNFIVVRGCPICRKGQSDNRLK